MYCILKGEGKQEVVMAGRYVYSLNGTDYYGSFESRDAAHAAGEKAARRQAEPPSTIFVARSIARLPTAAGHARSVLAHMSARGEAHGDGDYLAGLTDAEIQDLDADLEKTLLAWLARHRRMPTAFRVEAVSESTIPPPPANHSAAVNGEVHDLGVEAMP
jgi:hypothetical protein